MTTPSSRRFQRYMSMCVAIYVNKKKRREEKRRKKNECRDNTHPLFMHRRLHACTCIDFMLSDSCPSHFSLFLPLCTQVVQKLIPQLPTLENLLNILISVSTSHFLRTQHILFFSPPFFSTNIELLGGGGLVFLFF